MRPEELADHLWILFKRYPRNLAVFVSVYHLVGAAFAVDMPRTMLKRFKTDLRNLRDDPEKWSVDDGGEDDLLGLDADVKRALWRAKLPAGSIVNVFATLLLRLRASGAPLSYILETLETEWSLTERDKPS